MADTIDHLTKKNLELARNCDMLEAELVRVSNDCKWYKAGMERLIEILGAIVKKED